MTADGTARPAHRRPATPRREQRNRHGHPRRPEVNREEPAEPERGRPDAPRKRPARKQPDRGLDETEQEAGAERETEQETGQGTGAEQPRPEDRQPERPEQAPQPEHSEEAPAPAEQPDENRPEASDSPDRGAGRRGAKPHTAAWAIRAVRRQFPELTGRAVEQVTGVDRSEENWRVGVEVVEVRRVPDSADVLGQYDVEVDTDGDIVGYRRARRYLRGRADE